MSNGSQRDQVVRLFRRVFGNRHIRGIEIGTGCGEVSEYILNLSNVDKLWTIDPYRHFPGYQHEAGQPQEKHDQRRRWAGNRLFQFGSRCERCIMTSDEFFQKNRQLKVDFVWIDGHHSFDQMVKDLQFRELVKPGGIIGGHDYGLVDDVARAIKTEINHPPELGDDYTWWIPIDIIGSAYV